MSCKESIILQLHSKNTYQNVTDGTNENLSGKSILVDMKIVDMRIESGAARGDSFMDVLLELSPIQAQINCKRSKKVLEMLQKTVYYES
jgi:hypothetical protein